MVCGPAAGGQHTQLFRLVDKGYSREGKLWRFPAWHWAVSRGGGYCSTTCSKDHRDEYEHCRRAQVHPIYLHCLQTSEPSYNSRSSPRKHELWWPRCSVSNDCNGDIHRSHALFWRPPPFTLFSRKTPTLMNKPKNKKIKQKDRGKNIFREMFPIPALPRWRKGGFPSSHEWPAASPFTHSSPDTCYSSFSFTLFPVSP